MLYLKLRHNFNCISAEKYKQTEATSANICFQHIKSTKWQQAKQAILQFISSYKHHTIKYIYDINGTLRRTVIFSSSFRLLLPFLSQSLESVHLTHSTPVSEYASIANQCNKEGKDNEIIIAVIDFKNSINYLMYC